jgi:hypothetical protein
VMTLLLTALDVRLSSNAAVPQSTEGGLVGRGSLWDESLASQGRWLHCSLRTAARMIRLPVGELPLAICSMFCPFKMLDASSLGLPRRERGLGTLNRAKRTQQRAREVLESRLLSRQISALKIAPGL